MDIAFSPSVKQVQHERGSRKAYARVDSNGGFEARVTDELTAFLAEIDTAFLATASADGQPYVQHRGGPRGFIRVLDEHTLAFADFAGNRQYISLGNLAAEGRVSLILMDYVNRRRLKIFAHAEVKSLADNPDLAEKLSTPGYRGKAERAFVLHLDAFDWNCPQHITQRFDAPDVAQAIGALQQRIEALEAKNKRLREQGSAQPV